MVRFVFTSSGGTLPAIAEPGHIDSSTWAPEDIIEKAWSEPRGPQNGPNVYRASKILSERACWDFVRERKPQFTLNTIVPMTQIGEFVHPQLISSMNMVFLRVWQGDARMTGLLPMMLPTCLVNLQESGLLHLAALTMEDLHEERIIALGDAFNFNDVIDAYKKIDPDHTLPEKLPSPPTAKATVDNKRMMELLSRYGRNELIGLEESLRQSTKTG